jgi:hypothetical protein
VLRLRAGPVCPEHLHRALVDDGDGAVRQVRHVDQRWVAGYRRAEHPGPGVGVNVPAGCCSGGRRDRGRLVTGRDITGVRRGCGCVGLLRFLAEEEDRTQRHQQGHKPGETDQPALPRNAHRAAENTDDGMRPG